VEPSGKDYTIFKDALIDLSLTWHVLSPWRAVEVEELAQRVIRVWAQLQGQPLVIGLPSRELRVALLRRRRQHPVPLFRRLGTDGRAHVVHADRGDGPHPGVQLGCADHKTAAAANAENADAVAVNGVLLSAKIIHCRAEGLESMKT
jgi:hypothetical protein